MRPSRSNKPGLAHRGMEMKHTGNARWTILTCAAILGALSMSALAAPGDQPNPTDKFKNLEFREIGPATMGGRIDDWRHCDCTVGPLGGVGRDRRAEQPAKLLLGRWSVQVARRREDLEEDGAGGHAPHRANRDSSEESGCGVPGGAGALVGRESGARCV